MRSDRQRTSSYSSSSSRSGRTGRTRSKKVCMRTRIIVSVLGAVLLVATTSHAQGKLNVIATTEDLASIAREVGGDRITVDSIAKGDQDPHFVEAKASLILKMQQADLLVCVGRELDTVWLPPLIQQSRNAKIQVAAPGYLDASLGAM